MENKRVWEVIEKEESGARALPEKAKEIAAKG
jgi:hypothetical protein